MTRRRPDPGLVNVRKTIGRIDVLFLFRAAPRRPLAVLGSERRDARRPVSRVLSRPLRAMDDHSSGTSVAGRLARPTRAAAAETRHAGTDPRGSIGRPPLFGLAPGGVCRAAAVAGGAVRSYRTLSPLPCVRPWGRAPAVCFLWHFPWGRPRRVLPGTVFPWSPDFPPPDRAGRRAAIRPSGAV